jgi:hypothetical protein
MRQSAAKFARGGSLARAARVGNRFPNGADRYRIVRGWLAVSEAAWVGPPPGSSS